MLLVAAERLRWSAVVRHDVVPLLSAYLLLVAMLFGHHRSRRATGAGRGRPVQIRGWPPTQRGLAGFVVTMALGGYVVFMAVIVLYYLALGGETFRFIRDALTGGAWLGFGVAVPALLFLAWVDERRSRRRRS